MKRTTAKGPKYVRYLYPVIQALKQLGGSGRSSDVIELVASIKNVPESEQLETHTSGGYRFDKDVHFARQYLVWAGFIDSSKRGVWSLTEEGWKVDSLSDDDALALFRKQHAGHKGTSGKNQSPLATNLSTDKALIPSEDEIETQLIEVLEEEDGKPPGHIEVVLAHLRKMTPKGFENFCVRLLGEHGLEGMKREGGPRDKGIDGRGILRVNPFVSFSIMFQCKRYAEKSMVTSSEISTFRGSIPPLIDKGIFITTSNFTTQAKEIARDTDKKFIELISGEDIVTLMEKTELGLYKTFKVDDNFFKHFEFESS